MSTNVSSTITAPSAAPAARSSAAVPALSRGGFGQQNRPPRRRLSSSKVPAMSAEARMQIEAANRALIDEALSQGRATRYPAMWADGAVHRNGFGSSEG